MIGPLWLNLFNVTLPATLAPGPTISLLAASAATKRRRPAVSALLGVTVANALCAVTVWVVWTGSSAVDKSFPIWLELSGIAFLTFFAARMLVPATIEFIYSAGHYEDKTRGSGKFFVDALGVHYVNSLPFYAPLFTQFFGPVWTSNLLLVFIPTGLDLVLYALFLVLVSKYTELPDLWKNPKWRAALETLLALLIVNVLVDTSQDLLRSNRDQLLIVVVAVLLGLLPGMLVSTYRIVQKRHKLNNKRAWRLVSTWGAYFTVSTAITAIIGLQNHVNESILVPARIVAAFCAVVSGTLTFAKAIGELQDDLYPADPLAGAPTVNVESWKYRPPTIGAVVVSFLVALFLLTRWVRSS